MTGTASADLLARAQHLFPGGVNSPVRAFRAVGGTPRVIVRGRGAHVWDADGERLLDYIASWGAVILGHAHPDVVEAVQRAAAAGTSFGAPTPGEVELGELVQRFVPSMERMRFVSSGTEAVMSALRVARAATGRPKVVKFAGCYHGHADMLLVQAGSGVATLGLPGSAGVPAEATRHTLVAPYNDPDAVEAARENAKLNGVEGIETAVSDAFSGVTEKDFTLILSNPPYHTDFSVAKAFIEGAFAHLAVGGRLVMVVKRVEWYRNKMRTVFGDHERFVQTYFSTFKGMYFTGDGARRDEDGYYWITGRVDDVLNVSGHRLGTAEVESALVAHPAVAEAAVVGYPHEIKGQGIYCYVTLKADIEPSDALRKDLVAWVRKEIGPIATPDVIQWAPGLPKTRSGKIMRRILRKIAEGEFKALGDTTTLADPAVVDDLIARRAEAMAQR